MKSLRRKHARCLLFLSLSIIIVSSSGMTNAVSGAEKEMKAKAPLTVDFSSDEASKEPKGFLPMVGDWYVVDDKGNKAFAVDGRKWAQGKVAAGAADKARALYGDRYAEFLDPVKTYAYFPLAVAKNVDNFKDGDITVRFRAVGGRIDQAAGIAFNIKPNGDYLALRANALEHNLVLWKLQHGKRSKEKWVSKVTTPTNQWHELMVRVKGNNIKGYLNGREFLDYNWQGRVDGKVGLWSKADSVVYFDDFTVKPAG